jgi:hypothetical protein
MRMDFSFWLLNPKNASHQVEAACPSCETDEYANALA